MYIILYTIVGWCFKSARGLFQDYIDKWSERKIQAKKENNQGMYTIAKLMLNSLYGKFALNPKVRGKIPTYNEGAVQYILGEEEKREPIYIPVGTFVTSWARYVTISSAQKLYDRFIYADTDSLHLVGTDLPTVIEIDDKKMGAWKHEKTFTKARFLRQKSYIEEAEISKETYNKKKKENKEKNAHFIVYKRNKKYYELEVKCAGMPNRCYDQVTWDNFHVGSSYSGKLMPKHVKGGTVLVDIDFTIK